MRSRSRRDWPSQILWHELSAAFDEFSAACCVPAHRWPDFARDQAVQCTLRWLQVGYDLDERGRQAIVSLDEQAMRRIAEERLSLYHAQLGITLFAREHERFGFLRRLPARTQDAVLSDLRHRLEMKWPVGIENRRVLGGYIVRMGRWIAHEYSRPNRGRTKTITGFDESAIIVPSGSAELGQAYDNADLLRELIRRVEPKDPRAIFFYRLRNEHDMKYREIAKECGCSVAQVWKLVERAQNLFEDQCRRLGLSDDLVPHKRRRRRRQRSGKN